MSYAVSVGEDLYECAVALTGVDTGAMVDGDIISNDKFAFDSILNTLGGSLTIKEAAIVSYDSAGSPIGVNMDLHIFKNTAALTLGLASNAVYVLDYTNNVATDVKSISFTSWEAIDAKTKIAHLSGLDIRVKAKLSNQISISGALVARAGTTVTATHTITVILWVARN